MKISCNWINELISKPIDPNEMATYLTDCGLEVESLTAYENIKGGLSGLVVGHVMKCDKHPDADKLHITEVDCGSHGVLPIVCGAPNVATGQKVVVALAETTLFPTSGEPFKIKKSKIRGAVSNGMICAEDEIGIGKSHDGIILLPADATAGEQVNKYFNLYTDTILEIGLTPNRSDAASHLGVTRDLVACLLQKKIDTHLLPPKINLATTEKAPNCKITIQRETACIRYAGIYIEQVTVKPSSAEILHKLEAIGIKPINNIVDITNYVLHLFGQPLHAFDANMIAGNHVHVRMANENERIITLDGVERKLSQTDVVIADNEKPLCLAGIFGGQHSGVSPSTTSIFLESACFDASSTRKSSKKHQLKTDASFRFERGTDPNIVVEALKYAAQLIKIHAGGEASTIVDHYPSIVAPTKISLKYEYLDRLIGQSIDREEVERILKNLDFSIIEKTDQALTVTAPTAKVDVCRPADVVEEILRIYGYNHISNPSFLRISLPNTRANAKQQIEAGLSQTLCGRGYFEIFTNSLTKEDFSEALNFTEAHTAVKISNPLSGDLGQLRQTLLLSGLEAIAYNRNRKSFDLKFFEFGKVYTVEKEGYKEQNQLALYQCGLQTGNHWQQQGKPVTFFDMKRDVADMLQLAGVEHSSLTYESADSTPLLDQVLQLKLKGNTIATLGNVSQKALKNFGINAPVYFSAIELDKISIPQGATLFNQVSKFPEVERDLSMLIDPSVTYAQLEQIAYKTERKILKSVNLFDVYEGEKIASGKKSYALNFRLQDETQTLTEKQIDKVMDRIMQALEKEAGAQFRKS
ncbi:MAG: hypothetical protein RIQ89_1179 [Bacteroidota bacterium]